MTPVISPLQRTLSADDKLITEATLEGNYLVNSNVGLNLRTSNEENEQLLTNILKQLKIMNVHLSLMTDNIIEQGDIE